MEEQKESAPNLYEVTVAGKRVTFKQQLPLGDARNILSLIRAQNEADLTTCVPLCCLLIESWEFDGSPADPAAYEALDAFVALGIITLVDTHSKHRAEALIGPSPKV